MVLHPSKSCDLGYYIIARDYQNYYTVTLKHCLFCTRWSQLWLALNSITHVQKNSPQSKNQMYILIMRCSIYRFYLKGHSHHIVAWKDLLLPREGPPCCHSVVQYLHLSVILSAASCLLGCYKMQMEPSSPTLWDARRVSGECEFMWEKLQQLLTAQGNSLGCRSSQMISFMLGVKAQYGSSQAFLRNSGVWSAWLAGPRLLA